VALLSRPRRARLVDVARAAGTSLPIASRIINADPTLSVGQALRERDPPIAVRRARRS
jgi:hypothetical protein